MGTVTIAEIGNEPAVADVEGLVLMPSPCFVSQSIPLIAYVIGYFARKRTTVELNGVMPTESRATSCPFMYNS